MGNFQERFYLNFIKDDRFMYLWNGLIITLEVTLFATLIGICLGFIVAIIRATYDRTGKLKVLNAICQVYLTVIRGTPAVVQLLIMYFVIFGSVNVSKILVAVLGFCINSCAPVGGERRGGNMLIYI